MGLFKKKKKITSIEKKLQTNDDVEAPRVSVYSKQGDKLEKDKVSEKEKRMMELLEVISMAGQTKKFLICITIHDPKNTLKKSGGDLHHWTFQQDFPQDDRYGCLDEYANLMGLGDK